LGLNETDGYRYRPKYGQPDFGTQVWAEKCLDPHARDGVDDAADGAGQGGMRFLELAGGAGEVCPLRAFRPLLAETIELDVTSLLRLGVFCSVQRKVIA